LTHRQSRLSVRSIEKGEPSEGKHAIVVSFAPDSVGQEVLHFAESDPGSGSSHWVAIADDSQSIYVFGHSSSKASFVQEEDALRLRIVPTERVIYRLRACSGAALRIGVPHRRDHGS
jgi:hypothetical protein